jgi:hypothetical protein
VALTFSKATKKSARLRLALIGAAGSGKTYTAITVACALGGRVAVIDTERGSASKYADLFDFDVLEMDNFHPQNYAEAIQAAGRAGYGVVVIDSLSHAWVGKGGALEIHDAAVDRQKGNKNQFTAWREVTPHHNAMVEAIVQAPLHVIATMRAKTEYVQEKDERTGKTVVRKVGLAPVQRDGLEYEFDVVGDIDQDHTLVVSKSRCPKLADAAIRRPGKEFAETLKSWLTMGSATVPAAQGRAVSTAPVGPAAMAPAGLIFQLHAQILSRTKTKTWAGVLAGAGVPVPDQFEEPTTDDAIAEIGEWLTLEDARKVESLFNRLAAVNNGVKESATA